MLKFARRFPYTADATNLADLSLEEQVHRETYIAILNGALREVGSKTRFAERLGISRAYLSFLLHPDPCTSDSFRRPSLHIAEAISRALPVAPEVRVALLAHMQQAHMCRIQHERAIAVDLSEEVVAHQVMQLGELFQSPESAPALRRRTT